MILDHHQEKWFPKGHPQQYFQQPITNPFVPPVDRQEFDQLKKEVEEMISLLKRAKEYDEKNNEPDCELEGKITLIRKVCEAVGVNIDEIFKRKK